MYEYRRYLAWFIFEDCPWKAAEMTEERTVVLPSPKFHYCSMSSCSVEKNPVHGKKMNDISGTEPN